MPKTFFDKLKNSIAGGAIIIAFFSVFSRILGLLRDRLLAASFGAGDVLDCYYAAFKLPDLIFNTLILGALTVSFVPVFLEYWQKDKEEAWKISNSILNLSLIILFASGAVIFIFAPLLVPWIIAPGFNPEKQRLTIQLTRIMLVGILFLGASNVAGSVLNSFKKFLAFSAAPVMYNLGIIFGILFLVPISALGAYGLAWGVVIGTALHFLVQLPALFKVGYHWKNNLSWKHPGVKKIGFLMLPRTLGLAVGQINQVVITIIASTLASGSLAILNLANNLQYVPIGVFSVSLSVASFPYLSETASRKDFKNFISHFSSTSRRILFLIIPASVLMILLRAQIVRLVLGAGAFSWRDTILTFQSLGFFTFSLFASALIPLLARCFFALQDTKTPVLISLLALIVSVAAGIYWGKSLGAPGLALAFSVATIINAILLYVILRVRLGDLDDKKIIGSIFKISLASLAAAAAIQLTKYLLGSLVDMQTFLGVFIQFSGAATVGLAAYLAMAFALRCEEIDSLGRFFRFKKDINPINGVINNQI